MVSSPGKIREAPLRYELLFAAPGDLDTSYLPEPPEAPAFRHGWWRGAIGGEWDRHTFPTASRHKLIACERRFARGETWEESGMFALMRDRIETTGAFDKCVTEKDIRARYRNVDALYERVRDEGRLRLRWELDPKPEGEKRGIRVHMARDGRLLFAGRGHHRLAIALALNLPTVPVGVVVAHKMAVEEGHLDRLRAERGQVLAQLGLDLPARALGLRRPLPAGLASEILPDRPCWLDA